MEVDVTIYEPYRMLVDFFTADVVLRVQDRHFHVNKAVCTRLGRNFAVRSEIKIKPSQKSAFRPHTK